MSTDWFWVVAAVVDVAAVAVEVSVASACDTDADVEGAGGNGARRLGWVKRMSEMISRAMTCRVSWPLLKQCRKSLRFSFARVYHNH